MVPPSWCSDPLSRPWLEEAPLGNASRSTRRQAARAPESGPRLRLASIFTTAALPGAPVCTDDACNGCRVCERLCPAGAFEHRDDALIGNFDKAACTRHHITLRGEKHWPCGICVKVCPVGQDRKVYGSYTTKEYLEEKGSIEADPDDRRYRALVHLRRHGSSGDRIS